MKALYESLDRRVRPEDIAQQVVELLANRLSAEESRILTKAAKGSLKQQLFGYTSMLQDFVRPVGMQRQTAKAEELFATSYPVPPHLCDDPEVVESFIRHVSAEIRKSFGANDFREDRLNHQKRQESGLDISRRRYNKLFRVLTRMEAKLGRLVREIRKHRFTKIGKSGLASNLTWEDFSSDVNTAAFIAYYAARCNLRSEFTVSGQQKPYDEIADMLFRRCRSGPDTNWWAIAHVFPEREALSNLTEEQKGNLLGTWFAVLQDVAGLLKEVWVISDFNRQTMVVHKGDDSSTWNNTANAWNKARANWIALLQALDMEAVLEGMCMGKVLRLMAADVVAWHFRIGGKLNPDTLVWNELPLPWEVLSGQRLCPKSLVEAVCREHSVDPIKKGWTVTRLPNAPVTFRPTPELVHGVTIRSPFLATLLRKEGYFSGKP